MDVVVVREYRERLAQYLLCMRFVTTCASRVQGISAANKWTLVGVVGQHTCIEGTHMLISMRNIYVYI